MRSNMYCHTLTLHYYGYYSTNGDTMKYHLSTLYVICFIVKNDICVVTCTVTHLRYITMAINLLTVI